MTREFHGMTRTPEHRAWVDAIQRCTNPANGHFKDYGARGIEVRYTSFSAFFADIGYRPDGRSLDRIDNNGHYELGNCRWATAQEQALNQRVRRDNKPGIRGVHFNAARGLYQVHLCRDGHNRTVGSSTDFFEACCIRKSAENRYLSSTTQA